ncbi:MAG: hypothetical protein OHK005_06640 [Candidatus Methylacidiphilales bacterium]
MKLVLLIAAYALGMAGANLLLKLAALHVGWKAWAFFAAANTTGFVCVAVMPFALKLAPAHVVYAWALGLGFCLLQVAAAVWFQEPVSGWQWAGIGCVAAGLVLMQVR